MAKLCGLAYKPLTSHCKVYYSHSGPTDIRRQKKYNAQKTTADTLLSPRENNFFTKDGNLMVNATDSLFMSTSNIYHLDHTGIA